MDPKAVIKGVVVFFVTVGLFVATKPEGPKSWTPPSAAGTTSNPPPSSYEAAPTTEPVTSVQDAATQTVEPEAATINRAQPENSSPELTAITELLRQWSNAIVANNSEAEASCYSQVVEQYYGHAGIDNAFVRDDKQAFMDKGNHVLTFGLEDVTVEDRTDTTATIKLTKNVTWQGTQGVSGRRIRSQLMLTNINGEWKISGEQDYR